jgi:putative transposase
VSFVVRIPDADPRRDNRAVGVDLGVSTLAALSDGGFIPSLRAARKAERRLRVAQRALARKKHGSNARRKVRTTIARIHSAVARRRTEYLHQASARLVRDYDAIAIEKLNVKGLAMSTLAKDVHDASWARFISILTYKAARAGTRLIEVNPYNTSQECSACGANVPKDLGDRTHDCPHCGLSINRDLNAARNVLTRAGVGPGLRNVAGYGMRAGVNLDPAPSPRFGQRRQTESLPND